MTDLGMPTLIELPGPEDCARLCRELGLQFVELNMHLSRSVYFTLPAAGRSPGPWSCHAFACFSRGGKAGCRPGTGARANKPK